MLARQLTDVLVEDRTRSIMTEDVNRATETLIGQPDIHLGSLGDRLREPRLRAVLEPVIEGSVLVGVPEDDRQFAIDLGLVRSGQFGGLVMANPIYRDLAARSLASGIRHSLPEI